MSRSARERRVVRLGLPALALGLVAALATAPANASPAPAPEDDSGMLMNYVVNSDKGAAAMAEVEAAVEDAGGIVISQYVPIGVTVAQSSRTKFAKDLRDLTSLIDSAGATRTSPVDAVLAPKTGFEEQQRPLIELEPREDEQWGNTKLQSLEANEIQDGKKSVLVGVLDSGSNDLHEDLAQNFNTDVSVDCESQNGVPNTEFGAWRAQREHGTHTAGTVAAARNGIGVAGIAPGIEFASIKVSNDEGYYFPEYVLCGFWWAMQHDVDITNNSYFVDPWMFWCADDPDQGAVQESFARMIGYTHKQGMVHVAAAGNSGMDLANKTTDSTSPNDSEAIPDRPIDETCLDIPTEIKGVITVSAIQQSGTKIGFSNYGEGIIDVAAPGVTILSTGWPGSQDYHFLSGTSMASPHVTGVIALMESHRPDRSLRQITKALYKDSVDTACAGAPGCSGPPNNNGFYGRGVVNALAAVQLSDLARPGVFTSAGAPSPRPLRWRRTGRSGTGHATMGHVPGPTLTPERTREESPEVDEHTQSDVPWVTLVWNDPVNLMSYVSYVFQTHFGYSKAKAEKLMLQVHQLGKAIVASGSREEMERDVEAMHGYGLWATLQKSR